MTEGKRILIAEDDKDIAEILTLYLEGEGFAVTCAGDGLSALEHIKKERTDLLIADIMMPRMNGYELIREVQAISNIPIIIVSAKDADMDKILGLNIGADAYITKPFNPLEVVAYAKASLRRYDAVSSADKAAAQNDIVKVGELELDRSKYTLQRGEETIFLTPSEFKIMSAMMEAPGRVFSKGQLYEIASGSGYLCDENTIMVHISNLRAKLEENPARPKYIMTVRGLGYKIEEAQ